jgi:hypothetical protein
MINSLGGLRPSMNRPAPRLETGTTKFINLATNILELCRELDEARNKQAQLNAQIIEIRDSINDSGLTSHEKITIKGLIEASK